MVCIKYSSEGQGEPRGHGFVWAVGRHHRWINRCGYFMSWLEILSGNGWAQINQRVIKPTDLTIQSEIHQHVSSHRGLYICCNPWRRFQHMWRFSSKSTMTFADTHFWSPLLTRLTHTLLLKMSSDIILLVQASERVVYSPPHIGAFVLSSALRNPRVRAPIHLFRRASNSMSLSRIGGLNKD